VAALLQSQQQGDQQLPQQNNQANEVLSNLQGALGRRFGETQDFDKDYDTGMRGLLGEVPTLQSQFEQSRQRLGEDFTQTADQLDKQNTQNRERHLNAMADRGLGYSGANLVGQERIGEQFQKSVQGANQAYARGQSDMSTSEADAFRRIQQRAAEIESGATGRATARDETRKWQQQQEQMAQQAAAREQQQLEQQQSQAAAQQQQVDQQLRALEQQSLASSQPMPTGNGSYSPAAQSPIASPINTNSNISMWNREYNLRDPNEIKQMQFDLGLRPDGIIGPQTAAAIQAQNPTYFDDRPIDPGERLRQTRGTMYTYPGAPR
jgi:murein L,D-transpeptidase YcbB/YkuD